MVQHKSEQSVSRLVEFLINPDFVLIKHNIAHVWIFKMQKLCIPPEYIPIKAEVMKTELTG